MCTVNNISTKCKEYRFKIAVTFKRGINAAYVNVTDTAPYKRNRVYNLRFFDKDEWNCFHNSSEYFDIHYCEEYGTVTIYAIKNGKTDYTTILGKQIFKEIIFIRYKKTTI